MIVSSRQLTSLISILVILTGLTYYHRWPTGDDAWFAEQSYWFDKDGIIRSEFFRGVLGWENQLLVSHKLFLVFGACLMHIFGYQLPVVQLVGFIFFCVLVGELYYYVYRREGKPYSWYLLFILALIFSNGLLIKMSFENRPELMVAALGFGSFLCINAYKPKTNGLKIVFAGVLAGLAMLCHLNGVIFLIAGFVVLANSKQYKAAFLFSLVGGLTSLVYFLDILQAQNGFSTWYHQFRNDPATQNAFGWQAKLTVLLTYPRLFFESPEQASLSILLVYLLIKQRKFIRNLPVVLTVYSLSLFISFWLITKHGSGTYMPLFMPFMLALVYELYKINSFQNVPMRLVLALYLIIGVYGMVETSYKNFSEVYLPVSYERLRNVIPDKKSGLVPLTFFFNEYERHARLLSNENFHFHATKTDSMPGQMARWAHQNKLDFVLMDYKNNSEDFYPKAGSPALPFYKLTYYDGRFAVYKKQNDRNEHEAQNLSEK